MALSIPNMQTCRRRPTAIDVALIAAFFLFLGAAEFCIIAYPVFEEWDGVMQLLAGRHFFSTGEYAGWPSHYWPPMYPVLLGLIDHAGLGLSWLRQVSVSSGLLLLLAAHILARRVLILDKLPSFLAVTLIAVTWVFFSSAIQVENHMLDSACFVMALTLFFLYTKEHHAVLIILAGIFAGLAMNTRYTSYILILLPFFHAIAEGAWRRQYLLYYLSLTCICIPWWIMNYELNGSPLATWQFMNVGSRLYSYDYSGVSWWWKNSANYHGMADVVLGDLHRYVRNFFVNVEKSLKLAVFSSVGLIVPAVYLAVRCLRRRLKGASMERQDAVLLSIFLLFAAYTALVCNAFVFDQVFLSWIVVSHVLGIYSLLRHFPAYKKPIFVALAFLTVVSMGYTSKMAYERIRDVDDGGALAGYPQAMDYIRSNDLCVEGEPASCRIITIHPAAVLYFGGSFSSLPKGEDIDVSDVIGYRGLPEIIIGRAPKWPFEEYKAVRNEIFLIPYAAEKASRLKWVQDYVADRRCVPGFKCMFYDAAMLMHRSHDMDDGQPDD